MLNDLNRCSIYIVMDVLQNFNINYIIVPCAKKYLFLHLRLWVDKGKNNDNNVCTHLDCHGE